VAAQPGVTSPIVGPKTMEQLESYLKTEEMTVTEEDRKALDAIFPPGTHLSEYYRADFGPNARWL
jgi:aryl-alcohol dehydrogenase-like predicted oxidoreductase